MLLLKIELTVDQEARFEPTEATYKGSVFHGLVERAVSDTSNALWRELRGAPNQKARYALIPPQDAAPSYPAGQRIMVGVMLFGPAVALWQDVLEALMVCSRLGLGKAAAPLVVLSASLHHPDHPAQTHLQAVSARNPLPLWKAPVSVPTAQAADSITIELLSPTQINSQARREAPLPLTLSSIVKSLQQRLTVLEPTLAEAYGFEGTAWQDDVRAFWPHQIAARHSIQDAAWTHQSRNTRGPMVKQAIVGSMTFEGPVAASVVSLLDLGQWLAIGQSCSLGQGWYRLRTEDRNTPRPPPPLPTQESEHEQKPITPGDATNDPR